MTRFGAEAHALQENLVTLRRELHAAAEVGLDLPDTQRIVVRELEALGMTVTAGTTLTSVVAVLEGGRPGSTVLLRADMDALPIVEATALPFAGTRGAMHACGHDLHTAGLLGAAHILAAHREELPGRIVFMFQPGEEGHAGARIMIEEGVLEATDDRPVAAFALHVDCTTPAGQLVTREGSMMASASALRMTLRGSGGHAAFPHCGVDPVPVAAELILAVQTFAARRVSATDPAIISITKVRTDAEAGNVLPASVELEANIRTLSRETLDLVRESLPALLSAIASAHGCTLEAEFVESYPVTFNDPAETRFVVEVLAARGGADTVVLMDAPSMASEDFAYVLDEVPGTLLFLGVAPEDGSSGPMHSDQAIFDDGLLGEHAAIMAELAWRRLVLTELGLA